MPISYLTSPELMLRACEPEDLDTMYLIENDSSLWEVGSVTVPYSRYTLKQYIKSSQNDIFADKQLRLMVVHKADNRVIGIVDLTDFEPLHNRAAIGVIILKEYRLKGYAKQTLDLLCKYAFGFLHLHQLYAFIPDNNTASLHLFESRSFKRISLLKEWLQTDNANYKDAYLLQRINK